MIRRLVRRGRPRIDVQHLHLRPLSERLGGEDVVNLLRVLVELVRVPFGRVGHLELGEVLRELFDGLDTVELIEVAEEDDLETKSVQDVDDDRY